MKSLYDQIMDTADRLDQAAALLRCMADGNADAARQLSLMCRTRAYVGDVLEFNVDNLIAEVISDEDTRTAEDVADEGGEG
jgi:hypothetical protein